MYLYLGLIAIIPGIIYFTYFINRLLRQILNIHTNKLMIITIGLIVTVLSFPAMNTLELYGVIYYHLLVVMIILECLNILLKKYKWYYYSFISGILAILITSLILGYGYYNINHVIATRYQLTSDKLDNYKIIEIADIHMSTSIDVGELKQYCNDMNKENADIVVLVGDIFDENTPLKDMEEACELLGSISNKEGIYYVYGNHEKGYYDINAKFGPDEVKSNLEKNNIVVLEDQAIALDKVNIIGRNDASYWGTNERISVSDLLKEVPNNNYNIVLDHQPLDLDNNALLGIDLQLSGHTHGGQLFPMGIIQSLTSDRLIYGQRNINNFTAITTSGMSGWRYPIKTGAKSEYVVITIK